MLRTDHRILAVVCAWRLIGAAFAAPNAGAAEYLNPGKSRHFDLSPARPLSGFPQGIAIALVGRGIGLVHHAFTDRVVSKWAKCFGTGDIQDFYCHTVMAAILYAIRRYARIIGVGGCNDWVRDTYRAGLVTNNLCRRGEHLSDASPVVTGDASMRHGF